jgi:hypothetical protein
MNNLSIGNIGVITTIDEVTLFEITGLSNGLLYCMPLVAPHNLKICLPNHFWLLLDSF